MQSLRSGKARQLPDSDCIEESPGRILASVSSSSRTARNTVADCPLLGQLGEVVRTRGGLGRLLFAAIQWIRWSELAIFGVGWLIYQVSRTLAIAGKATAFDNAHSVMALERILGLDLEIGIQTLIFGAGKTVVAGLNEFYIYSHLIVTAIFFVVLGMGKRSRYVLFRNGFLIANAIALFVFFVLPVAPPRMFPQLGYVDTLLTLSGIDFYGGDNASVLNPYAAVPSMHFGYALMVGVGVAILARQHWLRVLASAYPAVMFTAIVATGNHYIVDAIAGGLVMSAGFAIAAAPLWLRRGQPALARYEVSSGS